jgi:hypothetical protein
MNFCSPPPPQMVCYVFRPSHPFVLDHPNNISWKMQIMKCLWKFLGSDSGCWSNVGLMCFYMPKDDVPGEHCAFICRVAEFGFDGCWSDWKKLSVLILAGWKIWSAKSLKSLYVISTVFNLITSASTKIKFSHPEEEAVSYYITSEGMCHPAQRSRQDWHMKLLDVQLFQTFPYFH